MWPLNIPDIAIQYNNQIVNSNNVNNEMTKSWRKSNNQWRKIRKTMWRKGGATSSRRGRETSHELDANITLQAGIEGALSKTTIRKSGRK